MRAAPDGLSDPALKPIPQPIGSPGGLSHAESDVQVVPFPVQNLNDIAGQLRNLADKIDSGEIEASAMICIAPQDDQPPVLFLLGENDGPYSDIGVLELAKAQILNKWLPA